MQDVGCGFVNFMFDYQWDIDFTNEVLLGFKILLRVM